jgi:predicted kinase
VIFDELVPAPGAPIDEAALRAFLIDGPRDADPAALAATPQDARWHAEGDVWIHTRMVVDALVALPAWQAQDPVGRAITFVAALVHDVGKPATTTREPDGAITSRGHSGRGDHLVRRWLWQRGVPFGAREHVCALVRHHQVPFFGITRPEAEAARTAGRLSLRLRHDWLALVAEADARGRRTADPAEQREIVDRTLLWIELCRELGCLDRPYPYASDHARILHLEAEDARRRLPDQPVHDDTTCEVTVMCGLPASGKSSWLGAHAPALPQVSLDEIREVTGVDPDDDQAPVAAAAREAARVHLRAGRDFAWNATNVSDRIRGKVIRLCRDYRARVRIVYCEVAEATLAERNRRGDATVPAAAISRMLDRWSVPALDEAHRATYVIDEPARGPVEWPPR